MAEYIEREALISELSANCIPIDDRELSGLLGCNESIRDVINAMPTADVRPERHGFWEWSKLPNGYNEFKCSACGAREATAITPRSWVKDGYHEYCGVCGAKMDGKGDNCEDNSDNL